MAGKKSREYVIWTRKRFNFINKIVKVKFEMLKKLRLSNEINLKWFGNEQFVLKKDIIVIQMPILRKLSNHTIWMT